MPNFTPLKVRAPYVARIKRAGEIREHDIEDVFNIAVKTPAKGDVVPVLTLRRECPETWEEETVPFVEIDGRLFRPFSIHEQAGPWTPARCAKNPPIFGLAASRPLGNRMSTKLCASPFLPVALSTPDGARQRARRHDPEGWEGARSRAQRFAERLRVVGGILYRETGGPGWVYDERAAFHAGASDLSPDVPNILIDPRHSKRDIEALFRRLKRDPRARVEDEFEIHDASRIPDRAEEESIAAFAVSEFEGLCNRKFGDMDPALTRLRMELFDAVTSAFNEAIPFDRAYEIVERLGAIAAEESEFPSWRNDTYEAWLFMKMLEAFPPPAMRHAPGPTEDADAILGAFRP